MNKKIIPAIIAKNQEELNNHLNKVLSYFDLVQLDVMDGEFVTNTSLFFDFNLPKSDCKYEAHLMIKNPGKWIDENVEKVDMILVHFESDFNTDEIIDKVKKSGKKIGFVLNPETKISEISSYLDDIDQVLIMTVEPGFYGSPFLLGMVSKIKELRTLKPDLNIEVDGGITPDTIASVDTAGANMFVSGSYLVKADSVEYAISNLKGKIN
jgi:ribulose-phosphate 3-epimerase